MYPYYNNYLAMSFFFIYFNGYKIMSCNLMTLDYQFGDQHGKKKNMIFI